MNVTVFGSFAFHRPCPILMKFTSLMQFFMLIPNMIFILFRFFFSIFFIYFFNFSIVRLGLVRLGKFNFHANYMTNAVFHADSKYALYFWRFCFFFYFFYFFFDFYFRFLFSIFFRFFYVIIQKLFVFML